MSSPRDHLRAAQAAELRGDKAGAIAELLKAAALYRSMGNPARALQLLRHARRLDPARVDLAEEVSRLEWLPDTSIGSAPQEQEPRPGEVVLERKLEPDELAEGAPSEWTVEEPGLRAESEASSGERALIERGPTRADPAMEAWCSFCCRPCAEVGELVAGPTGSFICAGCVGESRALLGLEEAATAAPARPARRREEAGGALELVGQEEARALLERGLQAGARRLLVLGPEGTGKTVWLRELARQERGALVTLDELEQGAGGPVVLVEDVDRLLPEAQARLASFLARHPARTVLMSARGTLEAPGLVLRGAAGSLPVLTTSALSQAVRGAVPLRLLEQVQLALPLHVPSEAEFTEIARRRLAARASELSIAEDVLAAFAAEAARSPRAGHELSALLDRVPAGSWSLGSGGRPARGGAPAAKSAGAKAGRRGRRKGAS